MPSEEMYVLEWNRKSRKQTTDTVHSLHGQVLNDLLRTFHVEGQKGRKRCSQLSFIIARIIYYIILRLGCVALL